MSGSSAAGRYSGMVDAHQRVAGRIPYAIDVVLPGMLHGLLLRSTQAHARICRLDVTRARALPGVAAVLTGSDLVASVPERHTGNLRTGMFSFPLPLAVPEIAVSLLWHPRLDADPAHRWLRGCVREVCLGQEGYGPQTAGPSSELAGGP